MKTFDESSYEVVYATRITLRNGKPLYAAQCGKKAFRFYVKRK